MTFLSLSANSIRTFITAADTLLASNRFQECEHYYRAATLSEPGNSLGVESLAVRCLTPRTRVRVHI